MVKNINDEHTIVEEKFEVVKNKRRKYKEKEKNKLKTRIHDFFTNFFSLFFEITFAGNEE